MRLKKYFSENGSHKDGTGSAVVVLAQIFQGARTAKERRFCRVPRNDDGQRGRSEDRVRPRGWRHWDVHTAIPVRDGQRTFFSKSPSLSVLIATGRYRDGKVAFLISLPFPRAFVALVSRAFYFSPWRLCKPPRIVLPMFVY